MRDVYDLEPADARDVRLVGYSPHPAAAILDAVVRGTRPSELPGDFVLTARWAEPAGATEELLVTSAVAAHPYYLVTAGGRLFHGPDVFDLVRRAGLPWRWNMRAVRSLAWLGHTIGEDCLHPDVRRVPPASIIRYAHGRLQVTTDPFWTEIFAGPPVRPDDAVDVFDGVCDELTDGRPLVSLSGGFDSRTILSRLLATESKPAVLTMGGPDCTDRVTATAIAGDRGLDHHVVEVDPADYLTHGDKIVRVTGGVKTACNWHTFFYSRDAARYGAGPHFVGSNGEFARSFFLDKGLPVRVAAGAGRPLLQSILVARIERRRRKFLTRMPALSNGFGDARALAADIVTLIGPTSDALDGLDRFYTTQRVRHFIGQGLALYQANAPTVAPFLDSRWIRAAAGLARPEKMGSNIQRRIIGRNARDLMDYPVPGEPFMRPRAAAGYWLGKPSWLGTPPPTVGYNPFPALLADPAVHEVIVESAALDVFASRAERQRIVADRSFEEMNLLLTLHFVADAAAR